MHIGSGLSQSNDGNEPAQSNPETDPTPDDATNNNNTREDEEDEDEDEEEDEDDEDDDEQEEDEDDFAEDEPAGEQLEEIIER